MRLFRRKRAGQPTTFFARCFAGLEILLTALCQERGQIRDFLWRLDSPDRPLSRRMPRPRGPDASFSIAPDSRLAKGRYIVATKTSERPATGDRGIVMVSADESLGGQFQFEYVCRTVTSAPKDHVHIARDESVEILEGTLHCRAGGRERVLRAGEKIVIAAGTPHALWNEDPSGCRAIGEHRPAAGVRARFEAGLVGTALPTASE